MRDMEELQKSHVLKVEELSRRKLTEDFQAATSFFQGSNVKTVYNFGDNDAKHPDAEIDDVHTRQREVSASLLQVITHKEKACFNVHSQFLASTEKPVNQELDNCQSRFIFGETRELLLADAKSDFLRHEFRADLAENNFCEMKRQIDSQAVEMGTLEQGVNSPDENEHFVMRVLEVFKSWKN